MAGEGTGPGTDREEVRPRVWPGSRVGRLLFPLSPPLIRTPWAGGSSRNSFGYGSPVSG